MLTTYIDKNYLPRISNRLDKFKQVSNNPYKANFRCPYCGDSQKDPNKRRGWIIEIKDFMMYKCFNCDHSTSFGRFLKDHEPDLFQEYKVEKFKASGIKNNKITKTEKFEAHLDKNPVRKINKFDPFKKGNELCTKISKLDPEHKARKYLDSRKIPKKYHYKIFYVSKFKEWVNQQKPGTFENTKYDDDRIVLPFIDENGYCFAIQGRSLDPKSNLRYITIKFDEDKEKIFGIDNLDLDKPNSQVRVVEGPIDSLFVRNCVAFAGSDGVVDKYFEKEKLVIILDNEPRNKEIVKKYNKYIENDFSIVIWPKQLEGKGKDINDYIMNGYSSLKIEMIIKNNTYKGIKAKMKFNEWKRVNI